MSIGALRNRGAGGRGVTPMGSIIALNRKTQSTFGWGSRGQNPGGGGE